MKLLRPFLLLLLALLSHSYQGLAQRPEWAQVANQTQVPWYGVTSSATDSQGNTYTWQTIGGPTTIGSANLTTTVNWYQPNGQVGAWNLQVCLAKFKSDGRLAWTLQSFGGDFANQAHGLAVDELGNIFVSGFNWVDFHLGTQMVADSGYFLARIDTSGSVQWVQHLAAYPAVVNRSFKVDQLTTDGQGNCLMLGYSLNTPSFSGQPLTMTGHHDAFIAKCNAAGQYQWVRELLSTTTATNSPAITAHLTADAAGNCVLTGNFSDTLTIGQGGPRLVTTPLQVGASPRNTFTLRYSRDGQLLWTRQGHTTYASGATIDNLGNIYVTGYASGGPTTFGPLTAMGGGSFLLKYDQTGTEQWLRATNSGWTSAVQTDNEGNVYLGGRHDWAMQVGPYSIPDAVGGSLDGFLLSYTPTGTPRWLYGFGGRGYDNVPRLGLDAQHHVYALLSSDSLTYLGGQPVPNSRNGTVLARFTQRANRLAGTVYLDQNANGRRDTAEGVFPRPLVLTNTADGQLFTADHQLTGAFQAFADTGVWVVQPAQMPAYYTVSQPATGQYSGHFAAYGETADTLDFGLHPIAGQADLRAVLTPYGAARPGFLARYRLTLENVGTTTIPAGTATVTLDARWQYVGSTPATTVSGRVVSWQYPAIAPFGRRELDVSVSLPVNTPLGTVLTTSADAPLAADVEPTNNVATASQGVTGSFDPNSIEVNYQQLTTAQVAAGQPLDYTIRFQNMGTDTAFVVVLTDTLDRAKLNIGSLQLVAQSHNCSWSLGNNGLLTVRFPNIQLPHRNIDAIRSQGFVRFRVQPRVTLSPGEIIPNNARIIFDYNNPLRTNTVTTAVLLPTALVAQHPEIAWNAYPNPATEALTVASELKTSGPVHLTLLDPLGRTVQQQSVLAPAGAFRETLDLRTVAPGLYVLRLRLPDGQVTSRQVVRK